jgi:hypothetical protein
MFLVAGAVRVVLVADVVVAVVEDQPVGVVDPVVGRAQVRDGPVRVRAFKGRGGHTRAFRGVGERAGSGGGQRKEPATIPSTKYRWAAMKMSTLGMRAMTTPASTREILPVPSVQKQLNKLVRGCQHEPAGHWY